MSLDKDISLLYELGTLRHVTRTWRQFGGGSFANVAEHSFRVAWLSMIIATHERADIGRTVRIALVHDLPETRVGDSNYLTRMYMSHNEDDALMHSTAGTCLEQDAGALWQEYRERVTLESKIVKDADNLDCDLELVEEGARGNRIGETLAPTRAAVYEKLYTDTARRMFECIQKSDPHTWHIQGRNRLTAGDWQIRVPPLQRELRLEESPDAAPYKEPGADNEKGK
jgi:putative hydrolase of HD superfamily